MHPKVRSPWLYVLLGVSPILLVLGAFGMLWRRAGERLEAAERDVSAAVAQDHLSRMVRLAPLFGEELSEDAGTYLKSAAEALAGADDLSKSGGELGMGSPPFAFPSRVVLASVWERARPAAGAIRRALQCTEIRRGPYPLELSSPLMAQTLLAGAELARLEGHDAEALRRLLLILGMNQLWNWAGGEPFSGPFSGAAAVEWNTVLDGHALTSGECAEFCSLLGQLEAPWPSLLARVQKQCLYRQIDALDYTRPDEEGNSPWAIPEPGWRQLWTRRLLAVAAVKATEADARELTRICTLPSYLQSEAAQALEDAIPDGRVRIQGRSAHGKLPVEPAEFLTDAWARKFLRLAHVATALAWYEAEQGRKPPILKDLVPKYLPALEPDPVTGKPIRYEQGTLLSPGWVGDRDMVWPVRRR